MDQAHAQILGVDPMIDRALIGYVLVNGVGLGAVLAFFYGVCLMIREIIDWLCNER